MRWLAVIAACCALALAGCGDDDDPEPSTKAASEGRQLTRAGADRARYVGSSGSARATACELVGSASIAEVVGEVAAAGRVPLERSANDSLDLSFCEFRERSGKQEIFVRIGLDTATHPVRRYYNMIVEARQLPNIFDPSKENRPKLVFGVGDDDTYGGAGAFWIPSRVELTSIKDERIVKIHFYVEGAPDEQARRAATELARLAYAGYPKSEGDG